MLQKFSSHIIIIVEMFSSVKNWMSKIICKTKKEFAKKIIGKDEEGKNIIAADIDKELDIITQYEIVYRNYEKGKSLIVDSEDN